MAICLLGHCHLLNVTIKGVTRTVDKVFLLKQFHFLWSAAMTMDSSNDGFTDSQSFFVLCKLSHALVVFLLLFVRLC